MQTLYGAHILKVKNITEIENVKKRATKLLPTAKDLEYLKRLTKLKLPTLLKIQTNESRHHTSSQSNIWNIR